jgi:FtsP/CotA-like multicopper oxidase with cupredoxin domain
VKALVGVAAALAITLTPLGVATSTSAATSTGAGIAALTAAKPDPKQHYKDKAAKVKEKKEKKVVQADRDAAAARALQGGALNPLMMMDAEAMAAAAAAPGEAPRYFSHPNYANSPLPEVTTTPGAVTPIGNPLVDRQYATDGADGVFVMLDNVLTDGLVTGFEVWNQADSDPELASAGKSFHAYILRPTRFTNQFNVVFDSGLLTMPALVDPLVSAVATFGVANLEVKAGDRLAFYGRGIPLDEDTGTDKVFYPSPLSPLQGEAVALPSTDFPAYQFLRTYSFRATMAGPDQVDIAPGSGIRKFVDELPGLGAAQANDLGQYIPAAVPDTTTYPGSDYYVIELGEYTEQMHSDLPATTLRGYRQANMGGTPFNYLGPAIVATKDRPVRILFKNLLPTGTDGNLFIPTDTTVMGSGMTAAGHTANPEEDDPAKPMCTVTDGDGAMKADMVAEGHCYAENRATLHLHGGITPWISDGTPHQWITPADQATGPNGGYPKGVSVQNVPDMPDPGPGAQTFFYTNAQSARLMFYHDHAWGITRLNVYAGEAAPYIITDDTEKTLVDSGTIPNADSTIPLVIQDKTFVPDPEQLALQDETWNTQAWGDKGDLWLPHVYSPAQNPGDASGVNAYGRWAYGPWFWPPTNNIDNPPIPNPYFDPLCDPDAGWCEPPLMPSTPFNSMGMEAFMDTPVVNGTAYPTVTLDPKSYRLRILNAANDRFFNLSLYQAVDANGVVCDAANSAPAAESTGVACTEVALNQAEVEAALQDPTVFPTPVAGTEGPDWISIGTEGGFLPAPVKVPAQPTTWVNDPTVFNAGNVDQHSLLVAPAERQDVIVDLSAYAGQTLIVYNDAPAAFPARDPRYDYYTGNGDYRESGGAASTLPGYGPNTRTIMQIKVNATEPAPAFDFLKLQAAFAHTTDGSGVFEKGQKPIVVGQGEYNSAYGTTFPVSGPLNGTVQIYDTSLTFNRLVDDATPGAPFTTSTEAQRLVTDLKPKMIQDEMGEAFEREYGRMSGFLGVETPNAQAGLQNMILYPYTLPPTEILDGLELPPGMEATPISSAADGTQIWKFTHNGVDTHPMHFHLYDVQLLNRVGWDGIVRKPDPTELGWKDTVRISPLEDTIVAVRPIVPPVPAAWNGLPNSVRLLDPSMPAGAFLENTTAQEAAGLPIFAFNPDGEPIDVVNHYVNFGWEYVLHCHILSHEEMDMMRSQIIAVNPAAPTFISALRTGNGPNRVYTVRWTDNSKNETAFVIERRVAGSNSAWTQVAMVQTEQRVNRTAPPAGSTTTGAGLGPAQYIDRIGNTNTLYEYQVYAINTVGDTWDYSNPAFNAIPAGGGFPTVTVDSRTSGQGSGVTVAAPTALTGTLTVKNRNTSTVNLRWTDNSTNETGFLIQRSNADGTNVVTATVGAAAGTGTTVTFTQSVGSGVSYLYRVLAFSGTTQSGWSTTLRLP